jgi:hypothetical protein
MVRANELTATQALGLTRAGLLSVEEMAQACLARIRERDPVVRGWVHLDPDLIQRNARELDKREVKGPLHGIPIAVKDVIMTADMPTEHNSPLYKGSFATVDAGCMNFALEPHVERRILREYAPATAGISRLIWRQLADSGPPLTARPRPRPTVARCVAQRVRSECGGRSLRSRYLR